MTAFAGVMVALVAMFLPTTVVDTPTGATYVPLDLARASHAKNLQAVQREDALVVAITRDGNMWFGRGRITPEQLAPALREQVRAGAERKVYIRVDRRANYGEVLKALSSVRSAGIENVAFLVNERNSASQPSTTLVNQR